LILQDTLHDAVVLSVFDFLLGFVVIYAIGLLIRGLGYIEVLDRRRTAPKVDAKIAKEV
jgi:hypothetical protein